MRKATTKDPKEEVRVQVMSVRQRLPHLGTRKLYRLLGEEFKRQGIKMGRDKLFEWLRKESLLVVSKRKYVKTTDSRGWMRQYPDLSKGLDVSAPEQLWVADITYLPTRQGYGYLHLITDAYSKRIMGYQLSNHMGASATLEALEMALGDRRYQHSLIHHSDRGLQYCSKQYTTMLKAHNIAISMTQTGSPYDNAIAERINGILKQEFGLDEPFDNLCQAKQEVHQSVMLYNTYRPHLSNGYLTPEQMHGQKELKPRSWKRKTAGPLKETSS